VPSCQIDPACDGVERLDERRAMRRRALWRATTLKPVILLLVLAVVPTLAFGDPGFVTGRVNGKPVEVSIMSSQSQFVPASAAGLAGEISIATHSVDEASGLLTMHIDIESATFPDGPLDFGTVSILTFPLNPPVDMFGDVDDGLEITVTGAERVGEQLHVTGTVSGTLIGENIVTDAKADKAPVEIDLSFDAMLDIVED